MNNRTKTFKELHEELQAFHVKYLAELAECSKYLKGGGMVKEMPDTVDTMFFLREVENLCEDLRKEAKARRELAGKLIAIVQTEASLAEGGGTFDMTVRGEFATGSPDMKQTPAIPRPGTDRYMALGKALGIPEAPLKAGYIRFGWSQVSDFYGRLLAEGKNPPPGLEEKSYTQYSTVIRRKKQQQSDE